MSNRDDEIDSLFGDENFSSPFMEESPAFITESITSHRLHTPAALDGHLLPTPYCKDAPDQSHNVSPQAIIQTSSKDEDENRDDALEREVLLALMEGRNQSSDHADTESLGDHSCPGCDSFTSQAASQSFSNENYSLLATQPATLNQTVLPAPAQTSSTVAPPKHLQNLPTTSSGLGCLPAPVQTNIDHLVFGNLSSLLEPQVKSYPAQQPSILNLPSSLSKPLPLSTDLLHHKDVCSDTQSVDEVDLGAHSEDCPRSTWVKRRVDMDGDASFLAANLKHGKP